MATYSLSSSFLPGTFLEMDLFFSPESYLGDSGKPTHFSLTWSCVPTQLTHTFIFSTELQRMGWIAEMLKL